MNHFSLRGRITRQELRYLMFWPVFLGRYLLLERWHPAKGYHVIYSPLDDRIPFCEWFLIPYVLWYPLLVGMHLYTLCSDGESFRRYSRFLIVSMGISTGIFLIYPSCQELRPTILPRENLLTRIVAGLYRTDTNTNVFPSEHCIGALGVYAAASNTRGMSSTSMRVAMGLLAGMICLSTVFLKQHSVLDVAAAGVVSAVTYKLVYQGNEGRNG